MPRKKRGRSRTSQIRANDEASASRSKASSSPLEDEPVVSKPRIQQALAVSDEEAATLTSQSSITDRDMDGHCSETLMLVKQILFGPSRVDNATLSCQSSISAPDMDGHCPETLMLVKQILFEPSRVDNAIPAQVNSEVSAVSNVSPSVSVPTSENTSSESDMSEPEDPMIEVGGYQVKKELAPLLKAIFKKYGDIAMNCVFSTDEMRSSALDLACSLYKRLEASNLMQVTQLELDSIRAQIEDLELIKVNIGWLKDRLDMMLKFKGMNYTGREAIEAALNEKKRALKEGEKKLRKLEARLQKEKDELNAVTICTGCWVDGLV